MRGVFVRVGRHHVSPPPLLGNHSLRTAPPLRFLTAALELDGFRVAAPLASVWLLPDFVTAEEEAGLLSSVHSPAARWTTLHGRRVQALGGIVHERAGLLPAPLPKWLTPLLARITTSCGSLFGGLSVNHVLVNEYALGDGILHHQDGPSYHPAVAIVSLGSSTVLSFRPHASNPHSAGAAVFLPRRSLLLFTGDAYASHLHGIKATATDSTAGVCNAPPGAAHVEREGSRVSLTCRAVTRVRDLLRR